MRKKRIILMVLLAFAVSLSGCATAHKQKDMEMQGLRNQITVLEAQIQSKDEEINSLTDALNKAEQEKAPAKARVAKIKVIPEVKSRPNIRQIQIALKNAGYAPGTIDGKMGRQTKDAIRAFQRANNLPVDGKIGKKTWALLKE
jgi:peptidoglycan hydrolase-like protein with peptidoglycan-binding domain